MAENSKIEWTDHTFNPWIGCTKVSPGCANCYAETLNKRFRWTQWGPEGTRKQTSESIWRKPFEWNKVAEQSGRRDKVFCASLADWLDHKAPAHLRWRLLQTIMLTPNLDWLLLTKRPNHFCDALGKTALHYYEKGIKDTENSKETRQFILNWKDGSTPKNVWAGISAENQEYWDKRIISLRNIPAKVHFVSAEPLLGPINMKENLPKLSFPANQFRMTGHIIPDWLIVGGESGPNARPINPDWVRSLRDQCKESGRTAFFFKQWGGTNKYTTGRELDGKTYSEFPKAL